MALQTHPPVTKRTSPPADPDFSLGWRYEHVRTPDGRMEMMQIPLTPEEALHPQEGFVSPENIQHDLISDDICDMLRTRYTDQPDVGVYRDLIIKWDDPALRQHAPDIAVVPNVRDRYANRGTFVVAEEGTRPSLAIEVVSPDSKEADRAIKVNHYARAGVQEYVYVDHDYVEGQNVWEIAAFRLHEGHYLPVLPDEDGAVHCETVGLKIGIDEDGQVWMQDLETGERLLTNIEAQQARKAAEARVAELEAQLRALQQGPDEPAG